MTKKEKKKIWTLGIFGDVRLQRQWAQPNGGRGASGKQTDELAGAGDTGPSLVVNQNPDSHQNKALLDHWQVPSGGELWNSEHLVKSAERMEKEMLWGESWALMTQAAL